MDRIVYTFKGTERSASLFQTQMEEEEFDSSTKARLKSWTEAWEGWKKYPILGWGVTGYSFIDTQYMKVLVETGAAGLITFFMLAGSIFRHSRKMIYYTEGKDDFYHGISIGFLAGFVGLLGHALGTNTFIIIRIMEPFWLFAAIVISIPRILPDTQITMNEKPGKNEKKNSPMLMGRVRA
ncbi:MAG: hypothetical protein HQ591_04465 [candidate division Zixibacteria bacterium]|nr:hypothetical protein [Candidatus Tariuqbacter arcticus]